MLIKMTARLLVNSYCNSEELIFISADEKKRGYINRLDFKVDGITPKLEDHPQYIDVAKLFYLLPFTRANNKNHYSIS